MAAISSAQPELKSMGDACAGCPIPMCPLKEGTMCSITRSTKTFNQITDREAALSRGKHLMQSATQIARTVPSQTAAIRELTATEERADAL
jgi:uncharacterized Zn finger protein (UPF0148 family)